MIKLNLSLSKLSNNTHSELNIQNYSSLKWNCDKRHFKDLHKIFHNFSYDKWSSFIFIHEQNIRKHISFFYIIKEN